MRKQTDPMKNISQNNWSSKSQYRKGLLKKKQQVPNGVTCVKPLVNKPRLNHSFNTTTTTTTPHVTSQSGMS